MVAKTGLTGKVDVGTVSDVGNADGGDFDHQEGTDPCESMLVRAMMGVMKLEVIQLVAVARAAD